VRPEARTRHTARLLTSSYLFWVLLAVPGVYLTYGYWQGTLFYGEFLHATGELSARLLIVTLAVTPLGLMFPTAGWVRWLRRGRRYLGVATFGYALLHVAAYVERLASWSAVLEDAATLSMSTGWFALILMLALALTSNDYSMRVLGRSWKLLHRTVYAAAMLSFAHWILAAFDPIPGVVHLGILAALEASRVASRYARSKRRASPIAR